MRRLVWPTLLALLAAGCGGTKTVTVTTTVTRTVAETTPKASVRLYFVRDGKIAPVARTLDSTAPQALLAALDAGPTAAERSIGIVSGRGRERTAEAVYTLSQRAPSAPVAVGGKSYTRADFEDLTPAILVESPLPFEAVSSPIRLRGTANTFEATFDYELLDPSGKVVAHDFVTATSGSGTRGTFDVAIPFEAPSGLHALVVFERSAADGSRIHQVEIPIRLGR